ncbi:hypothetical protein GCM10009617_19550 [Leifsonia poae]
MDPDEVLGSNEAVSPGGTSGVDAAAQGHESSLADLAPAPRSTRVRIGIGAAVVLVIAALVVTVIVTAIGQQGTVAELAAAAPAESTAPSGSAPSASAGAVGGAELLVHVLGAVKKPGLVSLAAGSRVVDAVAAAGGLSADADVSGINLARPVSDGEQLAVPRAGEVPAAAPTTAPGGSVAASGALVNINTASEAELATLPRIGPALAQRITDWRSANGRFTAPGDLVKVTGIGEKLFDGLKDRITV